MTSVLPASAVVRAAGGAAGRHDSSMVVVIIAAVCGIWVLVVVLVQLTGFMQLYAILPFHAVIKLIYMLGSDTTRQNRLVQHVLSFRLKISHTLPFLDQLKALSRSCTSAWQLPFTKHTHERN